MKKLILALFALLVCIGSLGAQESSYTVTSDFTYASKYVFRGTQYAAGSYQPSVKVDVKNAYFQVWANQPTARDVDNEIDATVGYNFKVDDTFSFDLGVTAYTYPTLHDHSTEGFVGANASFGNLGFGAYAYRDFNLYTTTYQGSVSYEVELSKQVSLVFSGAYGRILNNYDYWSYGVSLPVKVTESFTTTVGVQRAADNTDKHLWYTAGLTYTF